jgi:hypothetical protein
LSRSQFFWHVVVVKDLFKAIPTITKFGKQSVLHVSLFVGYTIDVVNWTHQATRG